MMFDKKIKNGMAKASTETPSKGVASTNVALLEIISSDVTLSKANFSDASHVATLATHFKLSTDGILDVEDVW